MLKINFYKKVYSKKAIKKAVKNYKKVADFEVNEKDKEMEVLISNVDNGFKENIKDEFSNHVLAQMTKNKIVNQ